MLFIPLILLFIVAIIWFKQYENSFFKKPKNYPDFTKINHQNKPIFIAFGDSLTQANMSADWLSIVEKKQPEIQFFNAGMNADLTDTLLTRIDEITECQPHFISLLIGSNDVMATTTEKRLKRYYDLGKIKQDPDFETFKANYYKIIQNLKSETTAKIMVVSIPPITENWLHEVNAKADKYANFIKEIASAEDLIYIPFREKLKSNMPEKSTQIDDYENSVALIRQAGFKRNFLGKSWNEIAHSRHAKYLTDNIHLNENAAEILAEMINKEINTIISNGN
jgi:lysophospholipase L1-like esterase